jgi:hypothetical protein
VKFINPLRLSGYFLPQKRPLRGNTCFRIGTLNDPGDSAPSDTDDGASLAAGTLNWADILPTRQTPQTQNTLKGGSPGDERIDPRAEIRTRYAAISLADRSADFAQVL